MCDEVAAFFVLLCCVGGIEMEVESKENSTAITNIV
jgi:hypothetical protein